MDMASVRLALVALLLSACGDNGGGHPPPPDAAVCDWSQTCDDGDACTRDRLTPSCTCAHDPLPNCCGNGVVEGNEACDDGNQIDFDGCSHDCLFERALAWQTVTLLDGTLGCDLDGNGSIDNAFGGALNQTARANFSDIITSQDLEDCDYAQVFRFTSTDITMRDFFHFTMVSGIGTETPPDRSAYFSGHNPFYVLPDFLDASGRPTGGMDGSAPNGMMSTLPGQVTISWPWCFQMLTHVQVDYSRLRLVGTLQSDGNGPSNFTGMLCGARSAASWHRLVNPSGFGGATLLDLIALGADFLGNRATPTQPDIDVDRDGLETFFDTDGDATIDLCVDGNGTQIMGTDCPEDPRIADAYSEAMQITAVRIVLAGKKP